MAGICQQNINRVSCSGCQKQTKVIISALIMYLVNQNQLQFKVSTIFGLFKSIFVILFKKSPSTNFGDFINFPYRFLIEVYFTIQQWKTNFTNVSPTRDRESSYYSNSVGWVVVLSQPPKCPQTIVCILWLFDSKDMY